MRITVVEFAGRGGLIHYTFQLCRALQAGGAEVTLVTDHHYELEALPHSFRLERRLRLWDPKPTGAVPASRAAALLRRLRRGARALLYYREWYRLLRYLRRERPDIVQFGDIRFPTDAAGLRLLRLLGLRLADVCHNVFPFAASRGLVRRSGLVRWLFAAVYRQFELVFVHFEVNRRAFLEAYRLPPSRVAVIPHGNERLFEELRDPALTAAHLRSGLGLGLEDRVVLFLGTLSRYKGTELLLEAFARVRPREPRARLVLAGFPAPDFDWPAHQALARRLGLDAYVRYRPAYVDSSAIAAWMQMAAVAVFPYRAVYQSGALHVAQTFGVPIVAAAVGAMPEVIEDQRSGLLVPPEDPEALAAALVKVLTDPALAGRLGRQAREDALGRFSWEGVATVMLERYRRLLDEARV